MVNNSNIVNAMVKYHFSDGIHTLPCKVDKQTHEVFDISGKTQLVKELVEDDDFSFDSDEEATLFEVYDDLDYAEVEVDGKLYPFLILEMIDEALQDGGLNPIEVYSAVEKKRRLLGSSGWNVADSVHPFLALVGTKKFHRTQPYSNC